MTYETIWTRKTTHFRVTLAHTWEDSPDLSWDDTGEVTAKLESGEWGNYTFRVMVEDRDTGAELGVSYLGNSIYADPREFIDHRECGRANREHAAAGRAGRCGSYFLDMVGEAIREARCAYNAPRAKLRAA